MSNSIQNQKMILLQYAKENRFPNPTFSLTMGIVVRTLTAPASSHACGNRSGTSGGLYHQRPIQTGTKFFTDRALYKLHFPKYNVRYIAINDHFDTIDPNSTDSDIAGIKNWFNEFFRQRYEPQNPGCAESKG